ncbi:plant intracellular Ras-group-related LRR protein 4-like [Olea europaea var. sylvestris]|uniref:plant intracellular Ras-group-related LRR protein 4-like n=1 Tax=Olea europaea var. sylvestris TaxID=158386 RepID=UPI000C1D32BD|nr:plant intracellular Ras-group-related LRR protein 4-like [Olea europaea var. sylvestris]
MIESIRCLEFLRVSKCDKLVSFSIDLGELPCISMLCISNCLELRSLPKGIGRLNNLRYLEFGRFSKSIGYNSFQAALDNIQQSKSLCRLNLYGWEHEDLLPYQLQHLTSLESISLTGFGIEALPEWFGGLSSLSRLNLMDCQKLRHMPSKEAMERLTKLEHLCS